MKYRRTSSIMIDNTYLYILMLCTGISLGHYTAVPQLECSYTFLVHKQGNNQCPTGAVNFDRADVDVLKAVIRNQQEQLAMLTQEVMQLKEEFKTDNHTKSGDVSGQKKNMTSGTNYVRWGRTICPDTAELLYWGNVIMFILTKGAVKMTHVFISYVSPNPVTYDKTQ